MRRIEVETEEERRIRAPLDAVKARLRDIESALWLLPSVSIVERLEGPLEGDAEAEGYRVHLGPVGVGSFTGTIRLELSVDTEESAEGIAVRLRSLEGRGNTDARIDFLARGVTQDLTRVSCAVWTQPRKDIPSFLPLSWVRRAASGVLRSGIAEALDGLAVTVASPPPGITKDSAPR